MTERFLHFDLSSPRDEARLRVLLEMVHRVPGRLLTVVDVERHRATFKKTDNQRIAKRRQHQYLLKAE